jgi:hypothetical protein
MMTPDLDDNKRQDKREMVIKSAKLVFGDSVIDCVVQNFSASGARVRTASIVPVPEQVSLRLGDGRVFPARRCWSRGMQIGLTFSA